MLTKSCKIILVTAAIVDWDFPPVKLARVYCPLMTESTYEKEGRPIFGPATYPEPSIVHSNWIWNQISMNLIIKFKEFFSIWVCLSQ